MLNLDTNREDVEQMTGITNRNIFDSSYGPMFQTNIPFFQDAQYPFVVEFKKLHPDAAIPTLAHASDSGYDVTTIDDGTVYDTYIEYKTGLAVRCPPGFDIKMFPRGSVSKTNLLLCNSVGLCDNTFTAELTFRFKPIWGPNKQFIKYNKGDRIGQLVFQRVYNKFVFREVKDLGETDRGAKCFGSTDLPQKSPEEVTI